MNLDSDGLARIQSESRIPANTWRQWCSRLELDTELAVELWEDVCHPMMLASNQAPDIPFILQLRAARPDLYIDDFRDELPAVLLSTTFLDGLQEEGRGALRGALLRLYRHLGEGAGPAPVARPFVAHAGALGLLGGVLSQDQGIPKLVRVLCSGRGALADLVRLGRRALQDHPYGELVTAALDASLVLLAPPPPPAAPEAEEEDDDEFDADDALDADDEELDADDGDAAQGGAEEGDDGEDAPDDGEEDDEEEEDDEGDAEGQPQAPSAYDTFLACLRPALAAVYADESIEPQLREARLKAIQGYNPLKARIPSMEEAQRMAARVPLSGEGRNRALNPQAARAGGGGSRPGGGGSRPGGGAPRATAAPSGGGATRIIRAADAGGGGAAAKGGTPGASTGSAAAGATPPATAGASGTADASETAGSGSAAGSAPATGGGGTAGAPGLTAPAAAPGADGKLAAPQLSRHDLDAVVAQVADGLTLARELDGRVWQLFADAEFALEDPRALAEALHEEDSNAQRAGDALRMAALPQRVRPILNLPDDRRLTERRFDLEAEGWLTAVGNNRRSLDPDSRLLISLPKILDRAAAGLLRLEALRAAVAVVAEAQTPEEATPEAVTARYEHLLSELTYLADSGVIAAARPLADADGAAVLAAVAVDTWVEHVRETALDWVAQSIAAEALASMESLAARIETAPLTLESPPAPPAPAGAGDPAPDPAAEPAPEPAPEPGAAAPFPEELAADTPLGELVDGVRGHVLRAAWEALREPHRPRETVTDLDTELRLRLRSHARITARRERHERNPRVALPVTSLERLSGNPELAHLFVRLTPDGRLLFLEDYEDGSYIDIFELRESTKRQMHARARERARAGDSGELQTGSSYLHTRGRTNNPFARTEAKVMAACVVDDEGEPVLFEPF